MPRKIKDCVIRDGILFRKKTGSFSKKDLLKQHGHHKDDMREARKLYRILSNLMLSKKDNNITGRKGGRIFSSQQKCIAKLRWGTNKSNHARFLEEYITQQKKKDVFDKPKLFSNVDNIDEYIDEYKKKMIGKHFKFIISPESPDVDCEALVKTLIARMEKITGFNFDWLSAIHTNTEHKHAHLLINGKDKNGKDINCFTGLFLKQTIREMCSQICTELVGQRTREQIENDVKKMPTVSRYCLIDKEIELYAVHNTNTENKIVYPDRIVSRDDTMYKRLCFLTDLGFAKKNDTQNNGFLLEKDWAAKLKTISRYNSFLKARTSLHFTNAADLELYTKDSKEEISGVVTKLFIMNDEDSWDNAVIVENKEKHKAYYIPMYGEPKENILNAEVKCSVQLNKKGNKQPLIKVINYRQENLK